MKPRLNGWRTIQSRWKGSHQSKLVVEVNNVGRTDWWVISGSTEEWVLHFMCPALHTSSWHKFTKPCCTWMLRLHDELISSTLASRPVVFTGLLWLFWWASKTTILVAATLGERARCMVYVTVQHNTYLLLGSRGHREIWNLECKQVHRETVFEGVRWLAWTKEL